MGTSLECEKGAGSMWCTGGFDQQMTRHPAMNGRALAVR